MNTRALDLRSNRLRMGFSGGEANVRQPVGTRSNHCPPARVAPASAYTQAATRHEASDLRGTQAAGRAGLRDWKQPATKPKPACSPLPEARSLLTSWFRVPSMAPSHWSIQCFEGEAGRDLPRGFRTPEPPGGAW